VIFDKTQLKRKRFSSAPMEMFVTCFKH